MADSWQRLGIVMAGLGDARENAYRERLGNNLALGRQGATLSRDLMENASLEQGLGDALMAQGYSPEEAAVVVEASRAKAGSDFAAVMQGLGRRQEQQFRQDAVNAATSGDWNSANANLFGVASGPQELAAVQGDTLLGNRFVVGGDSRGPTDIGRSRISTMAAQARASDASAASSHASAARTRQGMGIDAAKFGLERSGQWNPGGKTGAGGAGGKPLSAPVVLQLTKDAGKLQNLQSLGAGFKEDYAGSPLIGDIENRLGRMGWTGGLTGATEGQAEWWQQYDRYKNEVRNELFGASLTEGEQRAFEQADISPGMDPRIVKQNLAKQQQIIEQGLQRKGRVWAAQGYNTDAIAEATGIPLAPAGLGDRAVTSPAPVARPATPAPGARRRYNPATGRIE